MAGYQYKANTLDRMLDDLKTTVGPEVSSADVRHDSSLVSSFRSSSRNGERSSESQSRGGSRSRSNSAIGVEDGGRVKHTRHEYKPDDNSKVVTEKFEYDTGDSNNANHYQKKVIKSTYSTFSHQTAGSLDDPPHLLERAPESPPERPPTDTKVISASQKVANKLVHALSTIGAEEGEIPPQYDYSDSDTLKTETSVTTGGSDYSTLTRLKKNINELDSLIYNLDETEKAKTPEPAPRTNIELAMPTVELLSTSVQSNETKSSHVKQMKSSKVQKSVHVERSSQASSSISSSIEKSLDDQIDDQISSTSDMDLELRLSPQKTPGTSVASISPVPSDVVSVVEKINESSSPALHNGTNGQQTQQYDADEEEEDYTKSGEVRRIVWRNRYEKTYESSDAQQAPQPPAITIEEEARRRQKVQQQNLYSSTSTTSTLSQNSPPQRGVASPHSTKSSQLHSPRASQLHSPRASQSQSPRSSQPHSPKLQSVMYWPGLPGQLPGSGYNVSPGASSWAEPIPLPTPPQLSPREPGVAYIYTYGQDAAGSQVKPLPPLNYVQVPGAGSVPPSEGAPSPTPSQLQGGQPIIYHYSYHYNIMPNADGTMPAPGPQAVPHPTLQAAPSTHTLPAGQHLIPAGQPVQPGSQQSPPGQPNQPGGSTNINYNISSSSMTSNKTSSISNRTETTTHILPGSSGSPNYPNGGRPGIPDEPYALSVKPVGGPDGPVDPNGPRGPDGGPDGPNGPGGKNISITINKTTTTHTTHTNHPGHPGQPCHPGYPCYPDGPPRCLHETSVSCGPNCSFGPYGINPLKKPVNDSPVTSTPYPNRGRSISPEPRNGTSSPPNVNINYTTNVSHSTYSDSLDRVKRPRHHGLPFPDASPIKPQANGKIPRKVDDLMTTFTDSEDGPPYPNSRTYYPEPEDEPLIPANAKIEVRADASALAVAEAKPDPTKNVTGPAVYYPPGHEMFHETMHTMTLKESNRRGKAKWRMERAEGYKESSAHSEQTAEVKMIPVCLPLCCGAACTIM